MGKIADALGKYAQERKVTNLPGLTRIDLEALLNYNRKNGHLLNSDNNIGLVGNHSMEVLRTRGTIQRLMDNNLIFPGGKLTPKGIKECARLQQLMPADRISSTPAKQAVEKSTAQARSADDASPVSEADVPIAPRASKMESPLIAQPERVEKRQPQEIAKKDIPTPKPHRAEAPPPVPQEVKQETVEADTLAKIIKPPVRSPGIEKTIIGQPVPEGPAIAGTEEKSNISDGERSAKAPQTALKQVNEPAKDFQPFVPKPGAKFDENTIDENLISLWNPQSYEAEQFKILRTNLLFPVSGTAPKSILVTGALPGDGKSFVAANLAISIALNINKHVLLIDCDLRKPDLHRMFGFGEVPGLSEYLVEHHDMESLLLKTNVDKLTLLRGSVPPNPSELMSTERMSAMIEEVRVRYRDRLIVLDSPPPVLAAETAFLARYVDGIILVVKQGSTPREEVEDLVDTVGSDNIIGCVINHLDVQISRYYGRKKYNKYGMRYNK